MIQPNENDSNSDGSKVKGYFKYSNDEPNKVRCMLCCQELYNDDSTTLWNHMKFKHTIDRNKLIGTNFKDKSTKYSMTQTKPRRELKNQRKNLSFIDYNEFTLTSMKPSPSSSLSKNLISRLNQISSPVTRKLKFWNKKSFQVNQYDPCFKVIYLGNLGMQFWSKDESCLDKPLGTLWNNYLVNMKTEIVMRLTICNSGLKAITRQHGLTQYWSNRHEGKKMRQELRCHAVLCPSPEKAAKMVIMLNQRLASALQEFRREKKSGAINLVNNDISTIQQSLPRTVPLRRQILAKGSANFRPPLERSKSAPKLTSIVEEDYDSSESQASKEEFEYEQSFGDKDDSDYEDFEDEKNSSIKEDDESISRRADANSLTTTVNEETSNSSVCATSDSLNERHQQQKISNSRLSNEKPNGTPPVDTEPIGRFAEPASRGSKSLSADNNQSIITRRDVQEEQQLKSISDQDSHSRERQQSANNNQISSLNEHIFQNEDINKQDTNISDKHEAKKNTTINVTEPNHTSLLSDDDSQEIISSWSNFVIK